MTYRDKLEDSGMTFLKRIDKDEVILKDDLDGDVEVWSRLRGNYSEYLILIDGEEYEFVRRTDS